MAAIKGRRFTNQESRKGTSIVGESFNVLEETAGKIESPIKEEKATVDMDWEILEIPLSLLRSFPGNRVLRLSAIPQLAASIERTRLIHPIAVARDYEEDGKYIILSGHRRAEAYKLLNSKYADGKFSKIKAILVSSKESKNIEALKRIWLDGNFETRQLSLEDIVNNIDMFLTDISAMDEEAKRIAINQLKGTDISQEEFKGLHHKAQTLNKAEYIYEQFKDLDIASWSLSSLKTYLFVVENGLMEVRKAFLQSELPLYVAYDISKYDNSKQIVLLQTFREDPLNYTTNKENYLGKRKPDKGTPLISQSNALMRTIKTFDNLVITLLKNPDKVDTDSRTAIRSIRDYLKTVSKDLDEKLSQLEEASDK